MTSRPPYEGSTSKLLLAFDVGTTFSGISYSILEPGEVPEIRGVTRFPAQENVGSDSKIPTIIYYDQEGRVKAAGAEAVKEGIDDLAEEGNWTKAEWFKLHLRSKTNSPSHITDKIPPLPQGKTAVDVFADFLKYLFNCSRLYIQETHANGTDLWRKLGPGADFVLTHPNGWEGAQQSIMRQAAVAAGLIPNNDAGHSRLSFVTEGEASLHFCIQSGLITEAIKIGKGVMIVDAGGGTIDISTYKQTSDKVSFEEIAAAECHFFGSIFVKHKAEDFLKDLLKKSRFADDIPHIANCFDKTTKLRFRNADDAQFIKFGTLKDKDLALNIRNGQLKLKGSDVASFFEPSVQCIIESIKAQCKQSATEISSVFLVGGFAASDWLYKRLKESFSDVQLEVSRPDSHVNKAVAHGAISFYVDHFVNARVSKMDYGTRCCIQFQLFNADHMSRISSAFKDIAGDTMVPNAFSCVLPKNTKVTETQEFRRSFFRVSADPTDLKDIDAKILCYRGKKEKPKWMDEDSSMYNTLCHVKADTSAVLLKRKMSNVHEAYYQMDFDIILAFGLTELKAQICWEEDGVEKRSPAKTVYEVNTILRS